MPFGIHFQYLALKSGTLLDKLGKVCDLRPHAVDARDDFLVAFGPKVPLLRAVQPRQNVRRKEAPAKETPTGSRPLQLPQMLPPALLSMSRKPWLACPFWGKKRQQPNRGELSCASMADADDYGSEFDETEGAEPSRKRRRL